MENRKNTILLTVIAVATLLVAVIGATFAYFTAQGGAPVSRNVVVKTETADSTMFSIDNDLTLNANQDNFGISNVGTGLTSIPVNGTATFTASTGSANSMCYTLELSVTTNDFTYTVDPNTPDGVDPEQVPELTLTVTRATVVDSASSTNLVYGSPVTVLDAFDITTLNQTIYVPETAQTTLSSINTRQIACDKTRSNVHKLEATAGNTTSHKYVATIHLDNKNYDQQSITNKTFSGKLTFTAMDCNTPTVSPCS